MTSTAKIHVVAAVIAREGRYLLCKRPAHKRHGGLWEFPGGKLEPGETAQDAARRELAEELGVEVRTCGEELLALADPGSPFVIAFHPVEIEGEPACLEHAALAWVAVAEMAQMELSPSDSRFARFLGEQRPSCRSTR